MYFFKVTKVCCTSLPAEFIAARGAEYAHPGSVLLSAPFRGGSQAASDQQVKRVTREALRSCGGVISGGGGESLGGPCLAHRPCHCLEVASKLSTEEESQPCSHEGNSEHSRCRD